MRDGLGLLALAGVIAIVGIAWNGAYFFAAVIAIAGLWTLAAELFRPAEPR